MNDGLSEAQKAFIYDYRWEDTSVARCLSDTKTFLKVNRQLCILLGAAESELIGKNWVDITPEPIKTIDRENARLAESGGILRYKLPKPYQLRPDLPKCYFLMRVLRVPKHPSLDDSFAVFDVEFVPLTTKAYIIEVRDTLRNHLSPSDLNSLESGLSLSLLRKLSPKDWLTISGMMLLVIIITRIAFIIPEEKIPAILEKLLP